jgi:hypothetical protein
MDCSNPSPVWNAMRFSREVIHQKVNLSSWTAPRSFIYQLAESYMYSFVYFNFSVHNFCELQYYSKLEEM